MIKPKALKKGDTIAVLSPSSAAAHYFPHIVDAGIKTLTDMGFRVKEYETTRADGPTLAAHPELRARDMQAAFEDPEVDGIVATIGGEDGIRILKHLDLEKIMANPKLIMGYSDATTYLSYFAMHGMVTFYGPSIMAGLAQADVLEPVFKEHVEEFLKGPGIPYMFPSFTQVSHGYQDWGSSKVPGIKNVEDASRARWLQGESVEGKLFGGCLAILEMMKGTPYFPSADFFDETLLFIETSENVPPPHQMEYCLRSFSEMGILDRINGLLIARPRDYTQEMRDELDERILKVAREAGREDLPILVDLDFGHTDPHWVLPMGVRAKMSESGLELIESPFE